MEDFNMSADDWAKMWKEGKTSHMKALCDAFIRYKDELLAGRQHVTVFVPLCGKALEMKWLYDNGHEVVGVEYGLEALEQFFAENKIEYTIEDIPEIKGKLYKSKDGKIRLYRCDFYLFTSKVESGFGAVWDSGALNAINLGDQEKYVDIIKSVMGSKCSNLTVIDDPTEWEVSVDYPKLKSLFGDGYQVESRDYIQANEELKAAEIKGQYIYSISKIKNL